MVIHGFVEMVCHQTDLADSAASQGRDPSFGHFAAGSNHSIVMGIASTHSRMHVAVMCVEGL
jgi:hypothetical protein